MTLKEKLQEWRLLEDKILELQASTPDSVPNAMRRIKVYRFQQDSLGDELKKGGLEKLLHQRGHRHKPDCECRICWPQSDLVSYGIKVRPEVKAALKSIGAEAVREALEELVSAKK